MTRRADPIEELALALLEIQGWSSEDARCLAEDFEFEADRDRLMERIAQLAEEHAQDHERFLGRQADLVPRLTCHNGHETRCFDFEELVLHDPSGQCPRYHGGICRPLPGEAAPPEVRAAYAAAMAHGIPVHGLIRASGATIYPGSSDTTRKH